MAAFAGRTNTADFFHASADFLGDSMVVAPGLDGLVLPSRCPDCGCDKALMRNRYIGSSYTTFDLATQQVVTVDTSAVKQTYSWKSWRSLKCNALLPDRANDGTPLDLDKS